ncbi:MAG TPA: hypothetical protein VFW00_11425 [Rhodocyclaceae bacterium]|nr:hypothetical protein [Rhodocyclaceae bacterium]
MQDNVFIKTPAGTEEIRTRQLRLTPRLRSLLVLIDGKHSADKLLEMLKAIGVTMENVQELLDMGLIVHAGRTTVMPFETTSPVAEVMPVAEPITEGSGQLAALYSLFNGFIRPTFGLRGFMLQMQLEKCTSLDDYRALSHDVLTSLQDLQGEAAVSSLMSRIESIMGPLHDR